MLQILTALTILLSQLQTALAQVVPQDIPLQEELVTFGDLPLDLQKTIICESGGRQEVNGKLVVSKTKDVGIAQINLKAHSKTAKSMGLDLTDANDNLAFAKYLYEKDGITPWVCAKKLGLVKK